MTTQPPPTAALLAADERRAACESGQVRSVVGMEADPVDRRLPKTESRNHAVFMPSNVRSEWENETRPQGAGTPAASDHTFLTQPERGLSAS